MADDNSYLEKRIDEETSKVKAESYQKVASIGGWSGGGRTLWAISILSAVFGVAIGILAPIVPAILPSVAFPALSVIAKSAAVYAATGIGAGVAGGVVLGRITGSNAAVAQEQEKRMKEWTARQILNQNPNAEILPDQSSELPKKMSLKDKYLTYFNPRVGLTMAAIGVIGGLIVGAALIYTGGAAAFAMAPGLEAITGLSVFANAAAMAANPAPVLAYSAGVAGLFGALWSFNIPKIASDVTHFIGEVTSGKRLGREWGPPQTEKLHSNTGLYFNQDMPIVDGRRPASYVERVLQPPETGASMNR